MQTRSKVIGHTTNGSVMDDLKLPVEMKKIFKVKAELHTDIIELASRHSQAELQALWNESQPRVSDFMRGKITKFSLETLLFYAAQLGMRPQIKTTGAKIRTHELEAVAIGE